MILAAGGFEADPELRREHLGEGWENAKVRGTPYNTGEMIAAALAAGAAKGGDWGTCHRVQWDAFTANNESNRELTNRLTRQSYPLGIIVNRDGERFLDEGADFRNYTYAKYGKEILQQPGSVAYQIFDATLRPMLRTEEYEMPGISVDRPTRSRSWPQDRRRSRSAGEDRHRVQHLDRHLGRLRSRTSRTAARRQRNPSRATGRCPLDTGPFYAYGVTCGITFTFGGVKSDTHGRVLNEDGSPSPGCSSAVKCSADCSAPTTPVAPGSPPACLRPPRRSAGLGSVTHRPAS